MDSPTLPQDDPRDKPFEEAVLALRAQELSIQKTADALGVSFSRVQRFLARRKTAEANGAPMMPESALRIKERKNVMVHPSAPNGAPRLDAIEQRLSVIEAFVATLQHPPYRASAPSTPNGAPHRKRGFVIAQDLSECIDAYAAHHRLRVMDLLDTALREFLAARGWSGDEGE